MRKGTKRKAAEASKEEEEEEEDTAVETKPVAKRGRRAKKEEEDTAVVETEPVAKRGRRAKKEEEDTAVVETEPFAQRGRRAKKEEEDTAVVETKPVAKRGRRAKKEEEEDTAVVETKPVAKRGRRAKEVEEDTAVVETKSVVQRGRRAKEEEEDIAEEEEETAVVETEPVVKRGRRAKSPKPESEPEYFPDQRDLEDLWKQVFPVGTEWDQLDLVYQYKWDFSNLENAFEEGGVLHGKTVYMFGCTEPQLLFLNGQSKVTCIPVVVAVVSPIPPSDKIGIKSVQREVEEIIPMKQMKMDWVPYIPLGKRESQVERLKSQIFILSCLQRRAGLRHMKIERVKKFEYCLPYFKNPFKEEELEQSTIVDIMYPVDPKPVVCEFDWELDELEEFTDKLVEEEELSEDQKDAFKEFVKEKVREAKKANREAREARKKELAEMSEERKAAIENMKLYKFYPVSSPDTPDVSSVKSPFINRYYGKAHEVL